ncbi:MAG: hypothetical protein JNK55_12050 [Rubrivivax sp.]|nr:hypothetical protein [Rubrivivax sp.]
MNLHRRTVLLQALASASLAACGSTGSTGAPMVLPTPDTPSALAGASDEALLDDLFQRVFRFFWETANPANGLVPDRWPARPRMASIASVGFAMNAIVAGVEAGLVSRAAAAERVLNTARFFATAPQGPAAEGMAGHQGFFYHFLDMQTGHRYDKGVELSSLDTGLLLAGLLCAQAYFDGAAADEVELRRQIDEIYGRIQWPWMQRRPGLICMGWMPERGFDSFIDYHGYDEATIMVLLALASPTHPASADSWAGYTATYDRGWGSFMGQTHLGGAPLFWHQFSHVWVDFRGLRDAYMRDKGLDYFENTRRATLAQQAYAVANPGDWNDYGATLWGLTACDGPGMIQGPDHRGRQRQFYDYRARGAGQRGGLDDGTLAPSAPLSSLPFAPEIVLPTLRALHQRFGAIIYGRYGFVNAFNTSFRSEGAKFSDGRWQPGFGWVDTDVIGIDQGSTIGMLANHRQGVIWRTMQRQPALRRGLQRAGFSGGWLG